MGHEGSASKGMGALQRRPAQCTEQPGPDYSKLPTFLNIELFFKQLLLLG